MLRYYEKTITDGCQREKARIHPGRGKVCHHREACCSTALIRASIAGIRATCDLVQLSKQRMPVASILSIFSPACIMLCIWSWHGCAQRIYLFCMSPNSCWTTLWYCIVTMYKKKRARARKRKHAGVSLLATYCDCDKNNGCLIEHWANTNSLVCWGVAGRVSNIGVSVLRLWTCENPCWLIKAVP